MPLSNMKSMSTRAAALRRRVSEYTSAASLKADAATERAIQLLHSLREWVQTKTAITSGEVQQPEGVDVREEGEAAPAVPSKSNSTVSTLAAHLKRTIGSIPFFAWQISFFYALPQLILLIILLVVPANRVTNTCFARQWSPLTCGVNGVNCILDTSVWTSQAEWRSIYCRQGCGSVLRGGWDAVFGGLPSSEVNFSRQRRLREGEVGIHENEELQPAKLLNADEAATITRAVKWITVNSSSEEDSTNQETTFPELQGREEQGQFSRMVEIQTTGDRRRIQSVIVNHEDGPSSSGVQVLPHEEDSRIFLTSNRVLTSSVKEGYIYSAPSLLCPSAVHAGFVSDESGGCLRYRTHPGFHIYSPRKRNGYTSSEMGYFPVAVELRACDDPAAWAGGKVGDTEPSHAEVLTAVEPVAFACLTLFLLIV
ncbi:unnamed protein product [Amoebophrya sp. A25]|nr:unnamed protein product [Amoebophrya sp. A25]|eukprot:GSA25T00013052001.1